MIFCSIIFYSCYFVDASPQYDKSKTIINNNQILYNKYILSTNSPISLSYVSSTQLLINSNLILYNEYTNRLYYYPLFYINWFFNLTISNNNASCNNGLDNSNIKWNHIFTIINTLSNNIFKYNNSLLNITECPACKYINLYIRYNFLIYISIYLYIYIH
jgi:hypothetical protein